MTASVQQIADATAVVMRFTGMDGEPRTRSQEQLANAGIDAETIESAIHLLLDISSPTQIKQLHEQPALAVALGATLVATYITEQREAQARAERDFEAATGEGRR